MSKTDPTSEKELIEKIGADAEKKLEAQIKGKKIMFGMGLFGIVGFSIAIPTLLGTALGYYLDNRLKSDVSWTLTLLFLGLIIGCINAWHWVMETSKEDKEV